MTLRDKMLAVIQDVNSQVAEREELVELIAIALLTRNNLFILGKPGQAKSLSINLFRQRITGARQFERLLSKQTDEDQLFGRIDLSSLIPGSVPDAVLQDDDVHKNLRFDLQCMVVVEGRLQIREWQDKEGNKRRSAEINADNVYFGDSRPTQTDGASGTGEADAFKDFPPLDDFPSAAGSSDKGLPF